jgi:hypothetical protein
MRKQSPRLPLHHKEKGPEKSKLRTIGSRDQMMTHLAMTGCMSLYQMLGLHFAVKMCSVCEGKEQFNWTEGSEKDL